jgi:hypothetical protein
MIDNIQLYEYNKNNNENNSMISNEDNIFNTEVYNSILNQTVSVCQSHKENSILLKANKLGQQQHAKITNVNINVNAKKKDDSRDSLEKLINRIGLAEESKSKNNKKFLVYSESGTLASNSGEANINQERKTIEVSTVNKGIKIDGISNKFENNIFHNKFSKDTKGRPKITSDLGNMRAIREKLAESLKNKYDNINSTAYATNKSKSKEIRKESIKKGGASTTNTAVNNTPIPAAATHKTTQSMPKLTNNIFYIINPHPQLNTQITIYQNINNNNNNTNTGKTTNFSPPMTKDFNMTSNLASRQNLMRTSTDKKKNYKQLLRPELLSSINEAAAKKNPYEIKITKIHNNINATKRLDRESKNSRDHNNLTTRNVKQILILAFASRLDYEKYNYR